ncbi:MAG TPA: alpha/beta hydrolase [Steroidobacteraceae bacterium]|nr:alpha/beta hydrolase [Steroidobacteraceae bacterium]
MATGRLKAQARIRRGYFECRHGQVHVHNAIPPGGGFDEATPLIALHHTPMSGAAFGALLPLLGQDRSVYAPDLPGFGESDPPPSRPSVSDYAQAIGDVCDSMRFRQVDVVGYQSGSLVAAELALARPTTVRRLACIGVVFASDAEREALRRAPWPLQPLEDGSHLALEWERTRRATRSALTLERSAHLFAEKLRNGPHAWWAMLAALDYPARERLSRVTQPTLIIRPKDEWWMGTLRARELMPKAKLTDLTDVGEEALESAPERISELLLGFLTP